MNNIKPHVVLAQKRDFSGVLNAVFAFVGQEFKSIVTMLFIYTSIPILLLSTLSAYYNIDSLQSVFSGFGGDAMGSVQSPGVVFGVSILSGLVYIMVSGLLYEYIKLYHERGKDGFTHKDVMNDFMEDLGSFIGYNFLTGLMIVFGLILLVIPGLYIALPLSFIIIVKVVEKEAFSSSLSRCFKLIKGKWWATFGLIFITSIIANLVGGLFSLPMMVYAGIKAFFVASSGESADFNQVVMTFFSIISTVGSSWVAGLLYITIGFQYFNLREAKESISLIDRINNITPEDE